MNKFRGLNYRRPAFLLVLINHAWVWLTVRFQKEYNLNIAYIGLALLGLFVLMYTIIIACRMGDKFIVPMACMLITIGVIVLCRINIAAYGFKQIVWVIVGGIAFFAAYAIYYNI